MSTMIDSVRALLKEHPNLPELIQEAQQPEIKTLAADAYVYNGFDKVTLYYTGMPYVMEPGKITKVPGRPNYQEIDQAASSGGTIVMRSIPLKGEFIAIEMVDNHEWNKRGLKVLVEPKISAEDKQACDELGRKTIMDAIEQFKLGREQRKAGVGGYKINPDPIMYKWMQEHSPDDPMFAEQRKSSDTNAIIAAAIQRLTDLIEIQNTIKDKNALPPKKQNFESAEAYAARFKKWSDDMLEKQIEKIEAK